MINTCPEENASSPLETDSAYAVHIFFNYKYKNYAHHFTIYTPYIHVHQFSICLFLPELDSFHFYGLAGLVSGCRRRNCSFLSFSIKPPKFWSIFFLSSLLLYIPGEEDWRVVNKLWLYFIQLPSKSQFAPNT